MLYLRKIIDLLLYGNFFIAFCAIAMLFQTEWLLFRTIRCDYLTSFVFSATLFIYGLHRIVGMEKVKFFKEKYRYSIIERYKQHVLVYALVGGTIAIYYFFYLSFHNQILLLLPALLSLGYVIPFFGKKRRLRDFNYIKIFLVAIVWTFITVVLPIVERKADFFAFSDILLMIERFLFIFAITLPFDIRDIKVDKHIDVKTIPTFLGTAQSKLLAGGCLFCAMLIAILLYWLGIYELPTLVGLALSYVSTYLFIHYCDHTDNDYYFTGLMDGTMIIQFLMLYFLGK